jgi:glycosyltransferase involved in cell wall biosynthesis
VDPGDLPSNVVLHGHQPPRAVGELIAEFDVLLAPYRREVKPHAALDIAPWMSPLKIFEYMAAGKPIVAADLPVIREVLTDGETALLCSPDDDGDWVAALRRLHEEPELARRIGAQAHDEWRRAYTWQARASTILDWIDARLAASPAHPAGRLSGLAR